MHTEYFDTSNKLIMKHLIKNNEIVQSGLPSHFTRENGEGFWGGYETRTDLHFEDGWRDEVVPKFDPVTEQLGSAFYSKDLDAVTYKVAANQYLPSLEEAVSRKIMEIKLQAGGKLSQTDWYIIRQVENGKHVPKDIADQRELLRTRSNELELEAKAIADLREVLLFDVIF